MDILDFDTLMNKVKAHFKAIFLYNRSLFKPIRTYLRVFKKKMPIRPTLWKITTFSKIKTGLLYELTLAVIK
tara:strand:- start:917 stop:1132 length:216 start_codon:yes stop_codon:yes gene_type:complete